MSKRSAEIQITKEQMQNGSFNFTAGGPDDSTEPSKTAPPDVLSGRKYVGEKKHPSLSLPYRQPLPLFFILLSLCRGS